MPDVSTPIDSYRKHAALWELPRALMGGTLAMRRAGEKYLPREPAESVEAWKARLNRSTLFNGFRKTVRDMTGKVFEREVTLEDDVPELLQEYAENIDMAGRHLNVFARDVFFDALPTGINYILTDMPPQVQRADGAVATIADEQTAGIRPYLVHIRAEDLIGWKAEMIAGAMTLTQVRIRECVNEPDGEFGEKEVEQIRVLTPGAWATWRKKISEQGTITEEWAPYQNGVTSLQKITLTPVYLNRTTFMCGEPPLEDLADLNLAHWQSQSDQRNILHVARVPILFGAGIGADEAITIGANAMVRVTDVNAKLTFVEHSGKAIESGDKDLANLEMQMQTQGLQLLVPIAGKTATGEMHDESKENSALAMMAMALGDALEVSFGFMGEYMGLGEEAGGSVDVNTDFGVAMIGALDVPQLVALNLAGKLTDETLWDELKRRDILADTFDNEAEAGKLATQKPELDSGPGNGLDLNAGPPPPVAKQPGVVDGA